MKPWSDRSNAIQLTAKPLNAIAAPLAAVEGAYFSVTGYRATDSLARYKSNIRASVFSNMI